MTGDEKLPISNFFKRKSWISGLWQLVDYKGSYCCCNTKVLKYQNWSSVNFESNFVLSGAGQSNLNFPWLFINIQNFSKGGQSPWEFPRIILEWTHLWTSLKFSGKKVETHSRILQSLGRISLVMCSSNQIRDWILHWDQFFVSGSLAGSSFISFIWMKRNLNSKVNWLIFPPLQSSRIFN